MGKSINITFKNVFVDVYYNKRFDAKYYLKYIYVALYYFNKNFS